MSNESHQFEELSVLDQEYYLERGGSSDNSFTYFARVQVAWIKQLSCF